MAGAIDAQTKAFTAHEAKWEARISALEESVQVPLSIDSIQAEIEASVSAQLQSLDQVTSDRLEKLEAAATTRVAALESATAAFDSWRPYVESAIDSVQAAVEGVQSDIATIAAHAREDPYRAKSSLLGDPRSRSAAEEVVDGPVGHRVESTRRETGFGRGYTQTHLPPNDAAVVLALL